MTSPGPARLLFVALTLASTWSLAEPRRPPGAPPPGEGATCTALLQVRRTHGAAGCVIDERVTRAPGLLAFPCEGGAATADFGGSHFSGTVLNGEVDVTLRTQFHFTDGCDWESEQRIQGNLSAPSLAFTYREAPLPGQSRCANACRAFGMVSVRR